MVTSEELQFYALHAAESDAVSDHTVKAEDRNAWRKNHLDGWLRNHSESVKQEYTRYYVKAYRKCVKREIGKAKALLDFHGYYVTERINH